ncbi:hypothetical protein BABINDRAFT_159148 [Babjeviella inositovora NRRL Y-12698]|uniref:Condensin complex subunit 1 n=1 Tax=Babjeviella inositovora NRRL Y-12698 TaxID=984486 RepID=A0A1E3QY83_9ASCO|nr:uncharacterized protein BABINDRAFT_159148 [Babjeviella inositovora NRRL Y-12698]ODQ82595.1 hypothetical protein BABINDRAFT_159148 [Babjeviella inositovora NRRL Y-12698]
MIFNLSESLTEFQSAEKGSFSVSDPEHKLDAIAQALTNNPGALGADDVFEPLEELVLAYPSLSQEHQRDVSNLISSSMREQASHTLQTVTAGDVDVFPDHKQLLELYGYLMYGVLTYLGAEDHSAAVSLAGKKATPQAKLAFEVNCKQLEDCMEAITILFRIELSKLFVTTPERDLYVSLFTRPIYMLMENEQRVKQVAIKMFMFRVIAMAIKSHGHASAAQNAIMQNLTYFFHLTGTMAELLKVVAEEYDYTNITDEVLREISNKRFNSNDTNGPKTISAFIVRLSELIPRVVMKQMSYIAKLLDNSAYTLRCSVVEACGNITVALCHDDEDLERHQNQIMGFIDLLDERFLDQNPFVRTRAVQALIKLCDLDVKFNNRRQKMTELAVRSLEDRSSLVRRNSVKLMSKLLSTHPFDSLHGSQLALGVWRKRLNGAEEEMRRLMREAGIDVEETERVARAETSLESEEGDSPDVDMDGGNEDIDMDGDNVDIDMDGDNEDADTNGDKDEADTSAMTPAINLVDASLLVKAKLTVQYYTECVTFIETLHVGIEMAAPLLYSTNKNEVLETMDFFVFADAYAIETASVGIRRMLHLVWSKGASEEGKSISTHLMECYRDLFLTAPTGARELEVATYIAKNLIELTYNSSVADLASLEKLLCLMYEDGLVRDSAIKILWQTYNLNKELPQKQRRGAITVLGMLALANHEIALNGLDALLNVGLGEKGRDDLILARFTCICLQRIVPGSKQAVQFRIAREREAIDKLSEYCLLYSEDNEWYTVAEEAISAIYNIASHPDDPATHIVRAKTLQVFEPSTDSSRSQVIALSQLLFIVGHVAIKTIVHLEKCEAEFKKKKILAEAKKDLDDKENEAQNELEMIGGTSEDDFADAIAIIKERQLLHGEKSLLAKFGPLVKEICLNNMRYENEILQRSAVLCMEKLMCVSSAYCEENLQLLITIMEKSPDPIIRSNAVLGLGDMAVCFNNLVDENTDFLYKRLTDENIMVQRTCLMTVTFLILAGQVKVKGQLAQMAKCLENPDQGISDMCRLFFTELATKDNAIYNGFIDIFSGLSNDELLEKDSMKRIVKFLLSFIVKERHQKQLSDKLMARLSKSETQDEWNDVAFVLNTLPFKNDAITATLEEGFKMVAAR